MAPNLEYTAAARICRRIIAWLSRKWRTVRPCCRTVIKNTRCISWRVRYAWAESCGGRGLAFASGRFERGAPKSVGIPLLLVALLQECPAIEHHTGFVNVGSSLMGIMIKCLLLMLLEATDWDILADATAAFWPLRRWKFNDEGKKWQTFEIVLPIVPIKIN